MHAINQLLAHPAVIIFLIGMLVLGVYAVQNHMEVYLGCPYSIKAALIADARRAVALRFFPILSFIAAIVLAYKTAKALEAYDWQSTLTVQQRKAWDAYVLAKLHRSLNKTNW